MMEQKEREKPSAIASRGKSREQRMKKFDLDVNMFYVDDVRALDTLNNKPKS